MNHILALQAPFAPDVVSWRVGATNKRKWEEAKGDKPPRRGQPLCYVDARDVMRRLDEVCGPFGWQCHYVDMTNGSTCCEIAIDANVVTGEVGPPLWIWKANGGSATGDVHKESEREMAEKGGYSDAFKRAAVLWGIGQYLYDVKAPWIPLNEWWQIPDDEKRKLHALLAGGGMQEGEKVASKRETRADYATLQAALRAAAKHGSPAFKAVWKEWQARVKDWPADWRRDITAEKDRLKAELEQGADA